MRKRVHGLEMEMTPVCVSKDEVNIQGAHSEKQASLFLEFMNKNLGVASKEAGRVILPNQGQVYIDGGYIEICTPECTSIKDLVLHKRVSREIVANELRAFAESPPSFSGKSSVLEVFEMISDIFMTENTCGCHENYQVLQSDIFEERRILVPFLIARKLLEGTGLFYTSLSDSDKNNLSRELFFRISQRLPFINKVDSDITTTSRPIICTRNEPLMDSVNHSDEAHFSSGNFGTGEGNKADFKRRQILIGEHNQSPFCDFVKVGSTSLLWEMIEEGYFKEKETPQFKDISDHRISIILGQANKDFQSKLTYALVDGSFVRLCEVLEIYANWMLDYLENRYDGEKDYLYIEKTEVAKKIIYAADCFRREDIFALDRDIDWIIKLRWMQDYIKEIADIEIGDDEIDAWENLSLTLSKRWGDCRQKADLSLSELMENILWRHSFWHHLGPRVNYYKILEDYGLVNPLVIGGRAMNLAEEASSNIDKAPMNPPNRSFSRKQICDFMKSVGLEQFLAVKWNNCRIFAYIVDREKKLSQILKTEDKRILNKFPWNFEQPLDENPVNCNVGAVERFTEAVKAAIDLPPEVNK